MADPASINTMALDGHNHQVVDRKVISIATQIPARDGNVDIVAVAGTRFALKCGLGFDAKNADISNGDPFWVQGTVDCPGCA